MISLRWTILLTFVVCALQSPLGAAVIGSFDNARGGVGSIEFGSDSGDFRAHVSATFPSISFSSTNTLTDSYLNSVDVLVLGVVAGPTTPISPLSASEQTALLNFVTGGGSALLFTDNAFQFELAGDSLVGPFGLDAGGAIGASPDASVIATHPVTDGPFGTVSTIETLFPGWFPSLGPNATELAQLDSNGEAFAAVIAPNTLAPGSGSVVLYSDVLYVDAVYNLGTNVELIDNSLEFAGLNASPIPEPTTMAIWGLGVLGMASYEWRRRRKVA